MSILDEWTAQACAALGLDSVSLDQAMVLDLAREAAHGVARPAAPLTAYLVGLAVGRGAEAREAAAVVTHLARSWSAPTDPAP